MKKKVEVKVDEFKFKLGDKCFILGKNGICIITGIGKMSFISGGELNLYQVGGAHHDYVMEYQLLTIDEELELLKIGSRPKWN